VIQGGSRSQKGTRGRKRGGGEERTRERERRGRVCCTRAALRRERAGTETGSAETRGHGNDTIRCDTTRIRCDDDVGLNKTERGRERDENVRCPETGGRVRLSMARMSARRRAEEDAWLRRRADERADDQGTRRIEGGKVPRTASLACLSTRRRGVVL